MIQFMASNGNYENLRDAFGVGLREVLLCPVGSKPEPWKISANAEKVQDSQLWYRSQSVKIFHHNTQQICVLYLISGLSFLVG